MRATVFLILCAAIAGGCDNVTYVGTDEGGLRSFALTEDTAPLAEGEDAVIFLVEDRVELPLREPDQDRMRELRQGANDVTIPWDRLPHRDLGDYTLSVDWVLINLDEAPHLATVTLNGVSEFTEYVPGVFVDDEDVFAEFASWERTYELGPLERLTGTIRPEELDEVAIDLATVVNGVANADAIVHPDSHSALDPRAIPFVPEVIPALVAARLGIRTTEPANLVLEYIVRVHDPDDRLVRLDSAWELPAPTPFMPGSLRMMEETP